jgi:hypothetical protein
MKWKLGVDGLMILSGGAGGGRSTFDPDSPRRLKRWMSHVGQRRGVVTANLLLKIRLVQYVSQSAETMGQSK